MATRTLTYSENAIEDEFKRQARLRGGRPIGRLTEQHRMHPAIADLVSVTFYDGRLTTADRCRARFESEAAPHSTAGAGRLSLHPVPVVSMPYIQSTIGKTQGDVQPRWHDREEVTAVLSVLALLRARPAAKPPRLAVLSPYAQKVKRLSTVISDEAPGCCPISRDFKPHFKAGVERWIHSRVTGLKWLSFPWSRNNDHSLPWRPWAFSNFEMLPQTASKRWDCHHVLGCISAVRTNAYCVRHA